MYKDKDKQREYNKERMRKARVTQKGNTEEGNTEEGNTFIVEYVPASYVEGLNGHRYQSLPSRPRYLTLSDGQVLDRLNQPTARLLSGSEIKDIKYMNEASYNYTPNKSRRAARAILNVINKEAS